MYNKFIKESIMFTDFRDDDTQKLFSKALHDFSNTSCYGFRNNGMIVLTSDYELLKILANIERQDIINNTPNNKNESQIEMFNFGNFNLDQNQKLSIRYSNALYFRQGRYTDGCDYGADTIGGEKTLILTDSPIKLKKFINPIFQKHFSDFSIDLYGYSLFTDPTEALLRTELVVDNKKLDLSNDGNYCSRLLFRSAVGDINRVIDNVHTSQYNKTY